MGKNSFTIGLFLGRVVHFEFLRSLSVSLSLFLRLPFSLSLLSSRLSSSKTCKLTCKPPCVQRATPSTPNFRVSALGSVALQTTFFHSGIRRNDTCCNLSNFLADSCQQGVFSIVWSQPWLRVHILRSSRPDFMNCLFSCFMQLSCRPSLHWTPKTMRKGLLKKLFLVFPSWNYLCPEILTLMLVKPGLPVKRFVQDGYAWIFLEPKIQRSNAILSHALPRSKPIGRLAAQDAHRSQILVVRPAVAAKPKLRQ